MPLDCNRELVSEVMYYISIFLVESNYMSCTDLRLLHTKLTLFITGYDRDWF